jgi:alpha-amylase
MCTKWFSDGDVHKYFNPYNSPFEAYTNFMTILSDFIMRLENIADEKVKKELGKLKAKKNINKEEEMNALIEKYRNAFHVNKPKKIRNKN